MPLPTASGILRRIQDSIYATSPPSSGASLADSSSSSSLSLQLAEQTDPTSFDIDRSGVSVMEAGTSISHAGFHPHQQTDPHHTFRDTRRSQSSPSSGTLTSLASATSISSVPSGNLLSSELESTFSRSSRETGTRRRQPSLPTSTSLDLTAQGVLRRRILEIQQLEINEREKARRVQVSNLKGKTRAHVRN
jgi:hypothetical protein